MADFIFMHKFIQTFSNKTDIHILFLIEKLDAFVNEFPLFIIVMTFN